MPKLDPTATITAITELLLANPELDHDEVLRGDMVEGETDAFAFLAKIVRMIHSTAALAAGTAGYIDELIERKDRFERREEALRRLIFKVMNTAQIRKAELAEATLSIKQGVPKVVIVEMADIPPHYLRIKKEPDKLAIKAALVAKEAVPGAMLSNAEPVLEIRTK